MKIREYSGPLTVLTAGALGFSLICTVAAAALADPRTPNVSAIEAQDIVEAGFSNPINTVVALTVVEITAFIPTPTPSETSIPTASETVTPSDTPTRIFITWTPTRTRRPNSAATMTNTPTRVPSRTRTPTASPTDTFTPRPTFTFTLEPTLTATDLPPSETNTPRPSPTATAADTPTAVPSATPAPFATEAPTSTQGTSIAP